MSAAHYPNEPDKKHREACASFINGLPYMLACGECGYHLAEYLSRDQDVAKTANRACADHTSLVAFMVDIHNEVNRHTNKRLWTAEESEAAYSTARVCIRNNAVWKSDVSL